MSSPLPADPLDAQTGLDREGRRERARAAAAARWANADADERAKVGERLRAATLARFEAEVDPTGELPPETRRELAQQAWDEHIGRKARLRWARHKALHAAGVAVPADDDVT